MLALIGLMLTIQPAHAQLNIQIGGSEADFKAALARQGYDRIDTHKLGLSSSLFDACKDGTRWRIRFEWTGNTSRSKIGNCRTLVSQDEVRKLLADRGYRRITIEDRAGKYLAVGCQGNQRLRAEVSYHGDITREQRIGACEADLSPADIVAKLEGEGYDRIIFRDRQLPRYVAEACQGRNRLELVIDRNGEIRQSTQIGRCDGVVQPGNIEALLTERGYSRVRVIDDRLPRYIAEGCLDGRLMQITLNRWGEIADQVYIRPCRNAFSEEQIVASMRENGYTNVSVTREQQRFISRGCLNNRYMEIILSSFGELVSRRDLGSCDSPRINELAETLTQRGMSNLKFFAEGCERGSRVRITFDQFANRISRDVIGNC